MKSKQWLDHIWIGMFVIVFGTVAQGQQGWNFPDFSATQVFVSRNVEVTMKIYRSGSSVRVEHTGALSTLYVTAASKVYNLTTYPDKSQQCVSMTPKQSGTIPSPLELIQGRILKRTVVGSEVVEGHRTKVETVLVAGPDGRKIESRVWEAQDLKGIPVKIESRVNGINLQAVYRKIVIGSPSADLFAVPAKCTPFEKMWQVAESKTLK